MKAEKISGGPAVLGQFMLLAVFIPFIATMIYFMIGSSVTIEGVLLLLFFAVLIGLILFNGFTYADVYLKDDILVAKKLFSSKQKKVTDIRRISRSVVPLKYCFTFSDGSKVFFNRDIAGLVRNTFKSDADYLKKLRTKILPPH